MLKILSQREVHLTDSGQMAVIGRRRNFSARVVLVRPLINIERNSPFFLPLGLLCLASVLRHAGHSVEIIDYEYLYRIGKLQVKEDSYLAQLCEPLIDKCPHVIGITSLADTLPLALLMGRYLKENAPQIKVVLGGPGIFGTFPMLLERYSDHADYVCRGEGELALLDLVDEVGGEFSNPRIPGMYARVGDEIVDYGRREIAVLDDLPMPAYDMLPVQDYLQLASPRIFDMYLGSGCTYACKFCTTSAFWDRDFRSKSPQVVLKELDFLADNYGITQANFLHDNFANNRAYLDNFIDYFIEHNTKYEWGCAVRPDNVSYDQLKRMKKAGCMLIFCGTDSGSEKILRAMSKMPNNSRSYRFFKDCLDLNFGFETNTIIGYPDEGEDDLEASLKLVFDSIAHGATNADVSILQPLPGAQVTLDNQQHLVFVEEQQLGTFLPAEVMQMVRGDSGVFSGFSFIKRDNQDFSYYVAIVKLVRYFNRHFFNSLRFLKEICQVRYVDAFQWMAQEKDPAEYQDRFKKFIATSAIEEKLKFIAMAVYAYDEAAELLMNVNVAEQIENIYRAPVASVTAPYILLDLDFSVHRMFSNFPAMTVSAEVAKPATYLFFLNGARENVTLSLSPWQRSLWQALVSENCLPDQKLIKEYVRILRGLLPVSSRKAELSVIQVLRLFHEILSPETPQISRAESARA